MQEIWKDIPGYEGVYEASSYGRIRTKKGKTTWSSRFSCPRVWGQRIIKPKVCRGKKGRCDARVELYKDMGHKTFLVSRLIAETFLGVSPAGMTVNHKDGNPLNNRADNLEWLTLAENIRHGFRNGLYGFTSKTVLISVSDKSEYEFISKAEASRFLGRSNGYIHTCISKKRRATSISGEVYNII